MEDTRANWPYVLDDLVDDRNRDLYDEVVGKAELVLVESTDTAWKEELKGQKVYIHYAPTGHPISSFTHELLHAKLGLDGLTAPLVVYNEGISNNIIQFIWNELQHHKMYPMFHRMGFLADEFLNDSDSADSLELLERDVPRLEELIGTRSNADGLAVLLPYLVIRSPHESREVIATFEDRLRGISDPSFLGKVDAILDNWVSQEPANPSWTLAALFNVCNLPKIGFSLTGKKEDLVIAGNLDLQFRQTDD